MNTAIATDAKRRSAGRAAVRMTPTSRGGWIGRGVVSLALLALAILSVSYSLAQVVARSNPDAARRLAPYDGKIVAKAAAAAVALDPRLAVDAGIADLARRALRREPMAVVAAATIGLNAEGRQDKRAARAWFNYANRLSRRHSQTQLWAIEDAVVRNDIPMALRQYDIALRTSPKLADVLFPVLVQANAGPDIQRHLAETLAARPLWGDGFATYMAANADDLRPAAQLFTTLHDRGIAVPDAARVGILNALLRQDRPDNAWSYYAAITPGADRRYSRDPDFRTARVPSPFDWTTLDDQGISASFQHGPEGGLFDFSAPTGNGGTILQQLQVLPAGRYRLAGNGSGIDQPGRNGPYWVLRCANRRELGRVQTGGSGGKQGQFAGTFDVPRDCPVQSLEFVVPPPDAADGLSGQIHRVALSPTTGQS